MGRWDALKPDNSTETSNHQPSRRNEEDTPNSGYDGYKRPRGISRHRKLQPVKPEPARHATALISILEEQLQDNRNAPNFERTRVKEALHAIKGDLKNARSGTPLIHIVDLLEGNDEEMRKLAADILVNHRNDDISCRDAVWIVQKLNMLCTAQSKSSGLMSCLARFVSGQANKLPAEETTGSIVGSTLLSYLTDCTNVDSPAMTSICKSIGELLKVNGFSSAILAPLIQDVSAEGNEELATNLIRRNLFRCLQTILLKETLPIDARVTACSVLTVAMEESHKINKQKSKADVSELDQTELESFFYVNLAHQSPLYESSCRLLKALLEVYPATKLSTRLLLSERFKSKDLQAPRVSCPYCGARLSKFGHVLGSVHATFGSESAAAGLDCITALLKTLPLDLWLGQGLAYMASMTGFRRQVIETLVNVLTFAKCSVLRAKQSSSSVSKLCTTALLHFQWRDETMTKAGEDLWASLVASFTSADSAQERIVAETLINCIGGKVTPQGTLTRMQPPVSNWFENSERSRSFLEGLLQNLGAPEKLPTSMSKDLFCSILRVRPATLILCWDDFVAFCHEARVGNSRQQEACLASLEALLQGRRDFPSQEIDDISSSIRGLFLDIAKSTKENNPGKQVLGSTLLCYTAMTSADWIFLGTKEGHLSDHIEWLLLVCSDKRADVRRMACRAIAEFITLYVDLSSLAQGCVDVHIVKRVTAYMRGRLQVERQGTVQAMVLFALGNLAFGLVENDSISIVEENLVVDVSMQILSLMENASDKVLGNAIRSLGHYGSILISFGRLEEVSMILKALLIQIGRTVAAASAKDQANLTWGERSAAKKHGWGSWYSLGRILHALTDETPILHDILRKSVARLSQCVAAAQYIPDKIVLASMASMCELKPQCLVPAVGNSGLLGDCIAGICHLLFDETTSGEVNEQGQRVLAHLLPCTSIADGVVFLRHEEMSSNTLESLYHWMVNQEIDGSAFEIFALALQRCTFGSGLYNVSLEQKFASRALLQYKKGQASLLGDRDYADADNNGDDDEL